VKGEEVKEVKEVTEVKEVKEVKEVSACPLSRASPTGIQGG